MSSDAMIGVTIVTVVMALVSIIAVPWMLVRMPADYFKKEKPHLIERLKRADTKKKLVIIAKNLLGLVLGVAGIAMLVLPGQGVLTLIVALLLIDLPKKHDMEQALVRRPKVEKAINWLREKRGRPPIEL